MKLHFIVSRANGLKDKIIKMIINGELENWDIYINKKYKYLIHNSHCGDKGVIKLRSIEENTKLEVKVLPFDGFESNLSDFEGYYYGRFCELIFVNFSNRFSSIIKV